MNIHCCIDKECNETANYDKGHGDERKIWLERNHPGLLNFPVKRTLGGDRQDVVFEACILIILHAALPHKVADALNVNTGHREYLTAFNVHPVDIKRDDFPTAH